SPLVIAVTGCGGGAKTYVEGSTVPCLDQKQNGVEGVSTNDADLDYIAQAALGGGAFVRFSSGNAANIYFERTSANAKRDMSAGGAAGSSDLLKRETTLCFPSTTRQPPRRLAPSRDASRPRKPLRSTLPR